ncbi:MAG: hypothetical protein M1544_00125 [Candidatus Marsarchaeota archaeon]|nr:hypothetical protein [Candidatus Marsarchaeota archaeon]
MAEYNPNGGAEWWSHVHYALDIGLLKQRLKEYRELYFFFDDYQGLKEEVVSLFDKGYYLFIGEELIKERLLTRTSNNYGKNPEELKMVLDNKPKADRRAKELGFTFIDASLPAEEIIKIITN